MKKFFALIIVLLTITIANTNAETMLCIPDCPQDFFDTNVPPITTTLGSCTITIYWGHRTACSTYHDIIILAIQISGNCTSYTERQLMDLAALTVMRSDYVRNVLGWPGPMYPGDCVTNWRVNKFSCWRYYTDWSNTSPIERLVACDNDPTVPCCLTYYKICMDYLGREIITIEDEYAPSETCPIIPGGNPCKGVCDVDGRN